MKICAKVNITGLAAIITLTEQTPQALESISNIYEPIITFGHFVEPLGMWKGGATPTASK